MKKLTTSVLAVVLTSSFAIVNAQVDTTKTQNIDEVVITGALGIKKTADAVTSSQQVVTADEITAAGSPNAVQGLVGKVSGLQISQINSSVSDSYSIQLRGLRSISGNSSALIVIDNAISTAAVFQSLPSDAIESVNVIRGAQGAALYGADGVNGVIIVKTKQGAKKKLSVSYDGTIDIESVAFLPKRQTRYGQGWYNARDQYENGAWGPAFDGSNTAYGPPMYDYNGDGVINLDGIGWGADPNGNDNPAAIHRSYSARPNELKNFFNTGAIFNNTVTINAGGQDKYALLSINNTKRDFVVDGDKSNKTSVLFKAGAKLDKFSFDGSFNYIRTDYSQTTTMFDETTQQSLYYGLLQSAPDIPITAYKDYPDNAYAWNIYYNNPYWRIKHEREDYTKDYLSATLGFGYEINKHINLRYTGNLQGTFSNSAQHRDDFNADIYPEGYVSGISSALFLNKRNAFDYYGDFLINFDYDLTSDLNLKVNLGHNYQEHRMDIMMNGGNNLVNPGIYTMANISSPLLSGDKVLADNGTYRKNLHSLFANLDLAYKNFLFLNATARNEWSSVMSKDNNSYFYPSVGLSFVPTKAWDFGGNVLNYMKVSANWSRVGNTSAVDWYAINRVAELSPGYPYDSSLSFQNPTSITDPEIRPEFVTSYEANLDLGLFRNRVTIAGSIYQQETDDLITLQGTSNGSGVNSKRQNIGEVRSRGAEINLGLVPIKTSDFKWDINAGYSYNESVAVDTNGTSVPIITGPIYGVYADEGSVFPLIKATRMQRDDQGRIIIDPATGNPLLGVSLDDVGSAAPKSIYTFSTSFSYKGFRLGAVADYRFGSKFIADIKEGMAFNGTLYDSGVDRENGGFIMPNSVIPDGNGGYVPNTSVKTGGDDYDSAITWFSANYSNYGENFIVDGRAFKIREISLSYSLPKDKVRSYGLEEVTFGVHARNPFQKFADDNLNYGDPESSYFGGSSSIGYVRTDQYPNTKVYGFTLNVKF